MALIKCPDCGKEISDSAKVCNNCGKVMAKKIPLFTFFSIFTSAFGLFAFCFGGIDATLKCAFVTLFLMPIALMRKEPYKKLLLIPLILIVSLIILAISGK